MESILKRGEAMLLQDLLSALPFFTSKNLKQKLHINDIHMDHRNVSEGDIFVCIKGFTVDGHQFAEAAVQNGAAVIVSEKELTFENATTIIVPDTNRALAILAAKFYGYPTSALPLVGVTGTNGKTTMTYLLDAICKEHGKKTGLIGTIQMKIGDETFAIQNTTPDALHLQKSFKQMVDKDVDVAVMEVSSHALDLGRVYGCDFDVAVFTNLSQDHLDYHKDMSDYLRAKTLLFTGLGNTYANDKKYAVLNADDKYSEFIAKSTAQHILTYGLEKDADVKASNINLKIDGTSFTLSSPVGEIEIESNLIGKFNVYNMLAAASAAIVLDIPLTTIKTALEKVKGVAGRFEQVIAGQNYAVIVDYAHTPDSLENVLQTIHEFKEGKVYVVVGTGGDRDRTKRPLMAEVAVKYSDEAIFTSDNPRTEDPKQILNDMITGLSASNYEVIENRKDAIYEAIDRAEEGDIVLIAGKGHETYQEINGVRYDFDDRVIAKEAIEKKGI